MQVTYGMVVGGLERVVVELCRQVNRDRYKLSVCCLGTRGPLADLVEQAGSSVTVCTDQSRRGKYLRGFELARIFADERVDLVHAHHTPAFVDSAVGASLRRLPLIATDHCKAYPTSLRWRLLERAASTVAASVVVVSEQSGRDLVQHQGVAAAKVKTIYNGVDVVRSGPESTADIRRGLGFAVDDTVVVTAARLEPQKGLDLLLRVAPTVVGAAPTIKFLIVGGGSELNALRAQARSLNVEHHVVFTDYRLDAIDLMSASNCYVQTSHWEGLPMTLLEAMALRLPVVATAVGGVPEVVAHGVTGYLVHDREPRMLAEYLLDVVRDPVRAAQMGDAGYASYRARFSAKAMTEQYEGLYEQVLRDSRRTSRAH